MKEVISQALNTATNQRATYVDVRAVQTLTQNISTKNGAVSFLEQSEDLGLGIRVIVDGAWGFASTDDLSKDSIDKTAALAVKIAKASARTKINNVKLAPEKAYTDTYKTPIKIDPFEVPLERKLELLLALDEELRKTNGITLATGWMNFKKQDKFFGSSEGADIEQTIIRSGVGYSASATDGVSIQTRSYPASWGQHQNKGYELIEELPLLENALRISEEAVALLKAPIAPAGKKDLIIHSDHLALQIHESCGHPTELDRVLGEEAAFAGTSFLTLDKIGKFKYGSDKVNIIADSISPGGLGTFGYDDEGVKAQKWDLIKNGLLVGYLTSRETANIWGKSSRGAMRAESWRRIPIIRMVNISLLPGEWELEDLISDTKDGLFLQTTKSWSIDQQRLNFQFSCELAWEIKNGKKTRLLANPVYQGITPEFWNSCDAICSKNHWTLWGITECGKGEPMQIMEVAHGASPARFRGVNCGGG
jgi:TldD protein